MNEPFVDWFMASDEADARAQWDTERKASGVPDGCPVVFVECDPATNKPLEADSVTATAAVHAAQPLAPVLRAEAKENAATFVKGWLRDRKQEPPYTVEQIMNNFETMREVDSITWYQQLAQSVLRRGIATETITDRVVLANERDALLAAAKAVRDGWAKNLTEPMRELNAAIDLCEGGDK